MPNVAISNEFLTAFSRLPRAQQKKARQFTEKFRLDPTPASIDYEKIQTFSDPKVRTARIDKAYRAIIVHPPLGDVYLLVWVDHHDQAHAWARNKRFEVNPTVGSLQVFEVHAEEPPAQAESSTRSAATAAPAAPAASPSALAEFVPAGRLLAGRAHDELRRCAVPEPLLPSVRALRTEDDLEELKDYLPAEAFEALCTLALGGSLAQALAEIEQARQAQEARVDPQDFAQALDHPDSQRRFKLVESGAELAEMLAAPLQQWRTFLHPSQRNVVSMHSKGPARVLGGAGTGKTVVLMHRARHLAREVFTEPDDRILVTTYTRNLAGDLRQNLRTLCGDELGRIEVTNLHLWAVRFLRAQGLPRPTIASPKKQSKLWRTAYAEAGVEDWPLGFLCDEWEKLVQAQDVTNERAYLRARRVGRGTGLSRRRRSAAWSVFAAYRALLESEGLVEWADVIREARLWLAQHPGSLPYRAVLADEAQDFRTADLLLLRALLPEGPNDLFLVGDAHQRIYGHQPTLGRCGINVRGRRSRRLRLNYRTTEEIGKWAIALLSGMTVDDLDGGKDTLAGYRSLRGGPEPELHHFERPDQEAAFLVERVKRWLQTAPGAELCVTARTHKLVRDRYLPILRRADIQAVQVDTDAEADLGPGVRVATMHRLKGLEFPKVILAGVQGGVMPQPLRANEELDEATIEEHEQQERRLLFVAGTRARDELLVTGFGERCRWWSNDCR